MKEKNVHGFSAREMEVLKLVLEGLSTKLIAAKLKITEGTVELHRNKLIKKSNSLNMVDLAVKATKLGWVE